MAIGISRIGVDKEVEDREMDGMNELHERVEEQPVVYQCRSHRCGKCRYCVDNARWERIFAEKFEDPSYYEERLVRYSSPLA
jgi:hypothetical protein